MSDHRLVSRAVLALAIACCTVGSHAAAPAPKGDITVATTILSQKFNPIQLSQIADSMTYDFLFDGLFNLTGEGKQPGLATSYKVSADGKQIDFMLRKGVKFQNGDPFTAEDVKFTFEMIAKPDSTHVYGKAYDDILDRVDVVAPDHARFVMKQPWPAFVTSTQYAIQAIVPKNYYEKVGAKGFLEKPVGTGPFKLVDTRAGEWNKYEANPSYWGVVPTVQFATQRLVKEPFTRFAMLEKGEADIVMGITGPLLPRIKSNPKFHIFTSKYSGTSGLFFNKTQFPQAKDPRVRMAIAHAIDREGIAKTILGGVCEPAPEIFTPITLGYLAGVKQIAFDLPKAKELLAAAGGAQGGEVTFLLLTEAPGSLPGAPQVMEAIASTVEQLGFKIKRVPVEMGAYVMTFRKQQEPGVFSGLVSIPDDGGKIINDWYTTGAVWAHGHASRPEYEKIYSDQSKEPDMAKRVAMLQDFIRSEDKAKETIPLFWCDTPFAAGPKIKDWKPSAGSPYQLGINTVKLND